MPIAAFVLALVSLVVATLALGWNIAQFLLTGSRPGRMILAGRGHHRAVDGAPDGRGS